MQVHGGDIYEKEYRMDFSANINPLGTPPKVMEAACEGVRLSTAYPDIRCGKLRQAISETEQIPEDWIICGNGAAELIFALALAVKPGRALLVSPGFAEYEQALRTVDCQIEFYECDKAHGFALQEDYLERITGDLDIIFLCNPGNPTGLLIPQKLLEKIARRCRENHVLLVVDECFNGLLLQGEQVTMKRYLEEMPGLFLLNAFTKLYSMAGLRLGYGLCSDKKLLERISRVTQPWNVSIPAQMAGAAAVKEREFARQSREYIAREREFLKQGLQKLGATYYDSQANYIFFEGPDDLYEKCQEQGILIRDCRNYRGLIAGYYRIAVRTRRENEELLNVLKLVGFADA